ncbi:ABC transporter substrate-binding protein/permease [Facklamia sp. DSM 111018]|uniref:ABC transporter substrate-binding protein/permease n=1 Tax=Facklamia lactis TaxID=2749967 RepID=A0ABS0LSH2_9LACT|nr:ABC transporter substrate-binding protein/permease [Facklamia lactis]MBG9981412.1 ABC transporter substrate-binding protein/permease [Facklamia lactis]MBG9987112.1 ABC transporter substrate-binding protein/permease [Facklamia lactis]
MKIYTKLILSLIAFILSNLFVPHISAEERTYTVGTSGLTKPLNYFNEQKELTGFEIDLLKEIDQRLKDVKFEYEISEYSSLFAGLDSGQFDLLSNNLGENPERREKFLFSLYPYVITHNVLITSKEAPDGLTMEDMAGKSFGAVPSSPLALFLEEWNKQNPDSSVKIVYADSDPSSLIRDVYNGRLDATIYATTYLNDVEKSFGIELKAHTIQDEEKIRIPGSYFVYTKNNIDLRNKMDQAIAEMREDGTLSKISFKYLNQDDTQLTPNIIERNQAFEKEANLDKTHSDTAANNKKDGKLFSVQAILEALPTIFRKLPITLLITGIAALIGISLGFILALIKIERTPILYPIANIFVSYMRGTPLLVQLFLSYYGFPLIIQWLNRLFNHNWNINQIPAIIYAFIAMGLYEAAYNSETIRSALLSVNKDEIQAAESIGLTKKQTMWRIIIPSALIVAIPNLGNSLISLLKGTSLAFTITVIDMMGQAKIVAGSNLRFFESYIAISLIYWSLCIMLEWIFKKLEASFNVEEKSHKQIRERGI